jgi:hypothetical protein
MKDRNASKQVRGGPISRTGAGAYARAFRWWDSRRSRQASAKAAEERLDRQANDIHQRIRQMDAEMAKLRKRSGDAQE